jgi:diguanylate cyclase
MAVDKAGAPNKESPPPPFSLHEAEKIVRRLASALRAHGLWIHRVHCALICRTLPTRKLLAADDALGSELGRWLTGEKNELICRHLDHAAALEEHRQLRALARSLCDAVEEGRPIEPAEYQAFADCIGRLERSLEALVKELWDLLRHTDPLTGIATRYAMLPRIREEHQRVQRTGLVSSICMADLDHFKQINDTHGHSAGDAVLEAISAYLVANLRRYDQVCRYGGEEFVLMLPNTEPKQAVPIVDRLRRGLGELRIQLQTGEHVTVTASFGIAPLIPDQPIDASIERADQAMYAAKRAGRNQVRIWEPPEAKRAGSG